MSLTSSVLISGRKVVTHFEAQLPTVTSAIPQGSLFSHFKCENINIKLSKSRFLKK